MWSPFCLLSDSHNVAPDPTSSLLAGFPPDFFFFLCHHRLLSSSGPLQSCFLSSQILFSQLSVRCSPSHPSSLSSKVTSSKGLFPILMNEPLLSDYIKASVVREGPVGAAGTSLGWMVRTCVPYFSYRYFPVKFCTQFQCGLVGQMAKQFSTSWVCHTVHLEIASHPTG